MVTLFTGWLNGMATGLLPVLVDATLKGVILLTAVYGVLRLMKRSAASVRHLVWLSAMVGLVLLPLLSAALPAWQILPEWVRIDLVAREAAVKQNGTRADPGPRDVEPALDLPLPPIGQRAEVVGPRPSSADSISRPLRETWAASVEAPSHRQSLVATLVPLICLIWLAGMGLCLLPLVLGRLSLWRLGHRSAKVCDGQLVELLERAGAAIGLRHSVELLVSDSRTMPMVWGELRPKVLLPSDVHEWSRERCWVVLLHELAHVKRRDCVTKMVAHLACAVYWFNPLSWVAFNLMQREAEAACDDLVLGCSAGKGDARDSSLVVEPGDYAQHLLEIASGLKSGMLTAYSSIAMARPSTLEGRILAILDPRRNRRALTRMAITLAAAIVAPIALALAIVKASDKSNAFTGATMTLYADPDSHDRLPDGDPWRSPITITDQPMLERLMGAFPGMNQSEGTPVDEPELEGAVIRFAKADGRTLRVVVAPDFRTWSAGDGKWPVQGDFKGLARELAAHSDVKQFTIAFPEFPTASEVDSHLFYDLDAGVHRQLPIALAVEGSSDSEVIKDSGADILVQRLQGGIFHLRHVGMTYWRVPGDKWDVNTAVVRDLIESGTPSSDIEANGLPGIVQAGSVWAFRTSQGGVGLIQCLEQGPIPSTSLPFKRAYMFRRKVLGHGNALSRHRPRVGIYLVKDRPPGRGLENIPLDAFVLDEKPHLLDGFVLEEKPLLSDPDIVGYDWESHTIRVRDQAIADRFLKRRGVGDEDAFIVVADGQRLYVGVMRSVLFSRMPSTPVINVGPTADQFQPDRAIRIFPPPMAGSRDPRSDLRLKNALLATVPTIPDVVPAGPAAQQSMRASAEYESATTQGDGLPSKAFPVTLPSIRCSDASTATLKVTEVAFNYVQGQLQAGVNYTLEHAGPTGGYWLLTIETLVDGDEAPRVYQRKTCRVEPGVLNIVTLLGELSPQDFKALTGWRLTVHGMRESEDPSSVVLPYRDNRPQRLDIQLPGGARANSVMSTKYESGLPVVSVNMDGASTDAYAVRVEALDTNGKVLAWSRSLVASPCASYTGERYVCLPDLRDAAVAPHRLRLSFERIELAPRMVYEGAVTLGVEHHSTTMVCEGSSSSGIDVFTPTFRLDGRSSLRATGLVKYHAIEDATYLVQLEMFDESGKQLALATQAFDVDSLLADSDRVFAGRIEVPRSASLEFEFDRPVQAAKAKRYRLGVTRETKGRKDETLRETRNRRDTISQMRAIGAALFKYKDDHGGILPASLGTLVDVGILTEPALFVSPFGDDVSLAEPGATFDAAEWVNANSSYAYLLPGRKLADIENPAETVMLIDRDYAKGGQRITQLFADGHITMGSYEGADKRIREQTGKGLADWIKQKGNGAKPGDDKTVQEHRNVEPITVHELSYFEDGGTLGIDYTLPGSSHHSRIVIDARMARVNDESNTHLRLYMGAMRPEDIAHSKLVEQDSDTERQVFASLRSWVDDRFTPEQLSAIQQRSIDELSKDELWARRIVDRLDAIHRYRAMQAFAAYPASMKKHERGHVTEAKVPGQDQPVYYTKGYALLTLADVARARMVTDELGKPSLELVLAPEAAKRLESFTRDHIGEPLMMMVDGQPKSAPVIRSVLRDRVQVTSGEATSEVQFNAIVEAVENPGWGDQVGGVRVGILPRLGSGNNFVSRIATDEPLMVWGRTRFAKVTARTFVSLKPTAIEIDGEWRELVNQPSTQFEADTDTESNIDALFIGPLPGAPLTLGNHRVRVQFVASPSVEGQKSDIVVNDVVSNEFQLDVVPTGWGERVDGVRAAIEQGDAEQFVVRENGRGPLILSAFTETQTPRPSPFTLVRSPYYGSRVNVDGVWYRHKRAQVWEEDYLNDGILATRASLAGMSFTLPAWGEDGHALWTSVNDGTPLDLKAGKHRVQLAWHRKGVTEDEHVQTEMVKDNYLFTGVIDVIVPEQSDASGDQATQDAGGTETQRRNRANALRGEQSRSTESVNDQEDSRGNDQVWPNDGLPWGSVVRGLSCRFVQQEKPLTVGDKPVLRLVLKNVSQVPVIWGNTTDMMVQVSGSDIVARFREQIERGKGSRQATAAEVSKQFGVARPPLAGDDPFAGYVYLEPGGEATLIFDYPKPLTKPGRYQIECFEASRTNTFFLNRLQCPPVVLAVVEPGKAEPPMQDPTHWTEGEWGAEANGMQIRLNSRSFRNKGKLPALSLDLRNFGKLKMQFLEAMEYFEIEVDGVWYRSTVLKLGAAKVVPFGPGNRVQDFVWIPLERFEWKDENGNPLIFREGEHSIRVAVQVVPQDTEFGNPSRLVSNTIRLTESIDQPSIQKSTSTPRGGATLNARGAPDDDWGKANDGVQVHLSQDAGESHPGLPLRFLATIRNQGTSEYRVARGQEQCELDVDGRRFIYLGAHDDKFLTLSPGKVLENIPIAVGDRWYVATPVKGRRSLLLHRSTLVRLNLEPGKHSLRVIVFCESDGSDKPLVVESNAVEFVLKPGVGIDEPPTPETPGIGGGTRSDDVTAEPVPVELTSNQTSQAVIQFTKPVKAEPSGVGSPRTGVADLRTARAVLKAELLGLFVKLSKKHPQLAGAQDVPLTHEGWSFVHDCRSLEDRTFEDTGAFPVAITFKIMPLAEFKARMAAREPLPFPDYQWEGFGLVSWYDLHIGKGVTGDQAADIERLVHEFLQQLTKRDQEAFQSFFPEDLRRDRDRLLANADAEIRGGIRKLAARFPQLRKGQPLDSLAKFSEPGTIGIYLRRQEGGKGLTNQESLAESDAFLVLVLLRPPLDEPEQAEVQPLLPNLGLSGQVRTNAGDPELHAALEKLVADSLAPLRELDARAGTRVPGVLAAPPMEQKEEKSSLE